MHVSAIRLRVCVFAHCTCVFVCMHVCTSIHRAGAKAEDTGKVLLSVRVSRACVSLCGSVELTVVFRHYS